MGDFRMPSLGADMDEGILVEWLVKVGDVVHRGDIVAVVETPKSAVDVETFDEGTVQELLAEEGQKVPVGQVIALFGGGPAAREGAPRQESAPPTAMPPPEPEVVPEAVPEPSPPSTGGRPPVPETPSPSPVLRHRARELGVDLGRVVGSGRHGAITRQDIERAAAPAVASAAAPAAARIRVSPLARRLAAEEGIDLARLSGTGAGGSIRADDVRAALSATAARGREEAPASGVPAHEDALPSRPAMTDMRGAIAALMTRSNQEIPHYYLSATVDLHASLEWMRERNRELEMADRLVPAALLFVAAARAARRVPELNGHWGSDGFEPAAQVRLGFIVSLRAGGLLVPAIAEADTLSVVEMMGRIRDLTRRARSGRLKGSELAAPSITVSNLGEQGVESVQGVIYPPQVALVGLGTISERPWAVGGLLGVRPLVTLTLAGDHRATDGATGARYLKAMDTLLQRPEEL